MVFFYFFQNILAALSRHQGRSLMAFDFGFLFFFRPFSYIMNLPERFSHFFENLLVYFLGYRSGFFFVHFQPVRQIAYKLVGMGNTEHHHPRLVGQIADFINGQSVFSAYFVYHACRIHAENGVLQVFGKAVIHLRYLLVCVILHKFLNKIINLFSFPVFFLPMACLLIPVLTCNFRFFFHGVQMLFQ